MEFGRDDGSPPFAGTAACWDCRAYYVAYPRAMFRTQLSATQDRGKGYVTRHEAQLPRVWCKRTYLPPDSVSAVGSVCRRGDAIGSVFLFFSAQNLQQQEHS